MTVLTRYLCHGAVVLLGWAVMASAQTTPDPHEVFETQCLSCHGHAGSFARSHLHLKEGEPMTSRGLPVATFLATHKGGLPVAEIAAMLDMFRQHLTSDALYEQTCRFCHDRARDFTLREMILKDDRLTGRYSGHDIASFLVGHARLTAEEAQTMTGILRSFLDARP